VSCHSHVEVRHKFCLQEKINITQFPTNYIKIIYSTFTGFRIAFLLNFSKKAQTSNSLQKSGSENHVSSTTVSGVFGLPVNATAEIEEVKTTRFTDDDFAHDLRTLRVPFTAGSINST